MLISISEKNLDYKKNLKNCFKILDNKNKGFLESH